MFYFSSQFIIHFKYFLMSTLILYLTQLLISLLVSKYLRNLEECFSWSSLLYFILSTDNLCMTSILLSLQTSFRICNIFCLGDVPKFQEERDCVFRWASPNLSYLDVSISADLPCSYLTFIERIVLKSHCNCSGLKKKHTSLC